MTTPVTSPRDQAGLRHTLVRWPHTFTGLATRRAASPGERGLLPVLISTSDEIKGRGMRWQTRSGHADYLITRASG